MEFNELNMKMNNTHCAVALEFALKLNEVKFIYLFPYSFRFFILHNMEPTAGVVSRWTEVF